MAFQTDYSDVSEGFDILPEGEYEGVIKYAGEDATKGGTMYMGVTIVVRNDVDQTGKNAYIWHHIWQKKTPTQADNACGGYVSFQIQSLSKAVGIPAGKKFDSLSDWADELKDKLVRVTIEHEEYNGQTNAKVKWVNPTKYPECKHRWKSKDEPEDFEEVPSPTDEDLPF